MGRRPGGRFINDRIASFATLKSLIASVSIDKRNIALELLKGSARAYDVARRFDCNERTIIVCNNVYYIQAALMIRHGQGDRA